MPDLRVLGNTRDSILMLLAQSQPPVPSVITPDPGVEGSLEERLTASSERRGACQSPAGLTAWVTGPERGQQALRPAGRGSAFLSPLPRAQGLVRMNANVATALRPAAS